MSARDLALSSLCSARDKLGELIVSWAPGPGAGAASSLDQLLTARDEVSAAINAVVGAAFREVPTPELLEAARELSATAARLQAFGAAMARLNEVLGTVEQVLKLAGKVMALAA